MKSPLLYIALIGAGLAAHPLPSPAQTAPAPLGPVMKFPTNQYDFGKVNMGEKVKYTFIVSNAGDQTLEIIKVAPGCHCTTAAEPTRKIEPGKTGNIPLQFDSSGIHGPVTRTIMVTSSDKHTPNQILTIKGTVWRMIEIEPQFAYLNIAPDAISNASTVVHINNQSDQPVKISQPTSANKSFKAELTELKPGKQYDLTITAVPPLAAGSTGGSITLATSLTNMPTLNVTVMAMVQQAISVAPMQIVVPVSLTAPMTNIVNLTANGSRPLVLSDAKVCCDPRITVELKEFTPGRSYQLFAVFPAGFQLKGNETAQIAIKSNHPLEPEIIVPIRQYPRMPVQAAPLARPHAMNQTTPPFPGAGHP